MAPPAKKGKIPTEKKENLLKESKKESSPKKSTSAVVKKKRKRNIDSFGIYVYRVLKSIYPEMGISNRAISVMNSYIMDMFERIVMEATFLVNLHKRRTLSDREIQTATKLVIPGDLAKHAVIEGSKAVEKYKSNVE